MRIRFEVLTETNPRDGLYAIEAAPPESGRPNRLYQIGGTALDPGRAASCNFEGPNPNQLGPNNTFEGYRRPCILGSLSRPI
jgi:hypothetical protein